MTALQRVLHVEDDQSIRVVTKVALEKMGNMEVLSCESGFQALEKVAAFQPQLILLDVMMPLMDGPTTLGKLRETIDLGDILVLFMTAKVQQKELDYYRSIGAAEVIIKPFNPMTLADQLKAQWERFQQGRD